MFKWIDRCRLACAVVVFVLTPVAVIGLQESPPQQVRSAAVSGTPAEFVAALVAAKRPTGAILGEYDERGSQERGPVDVGDDIASFDDALRAFETRHQDYRVDRTPADGFVISPRATSPCAAALRGVRKSVFETGGALEVFYRLYRLWTNDTTPYIPPGVVSRTDGRTDIFRAGVAVNLIEVSLEDALNAVVEQSLGLAWVVREAALPFEQPDGSGGLTRKCTLVFSDGSSWLETSWVFVVRTRAQ